MRQVTCVAVLLSLSALTADAAVPSRSAPVAASVDQLIERLAHRDYRMRQEAMHAIRSLGFDVLPALRKVRTHPDSEVRRRVNQLITDFERLQALTSKPITLKVTNKPLKDIVAELAKQSGYKIPTTDGTWNSPAGKKPLTFNLENVSFWRALDDVCEAGGLFLQHQQGGDDNLRLHFQDNYVPFKCYDGPFKVIATGFNYSRNITLGAAPRYIYYPDYSNGEHLSMSLMLVVEPKLPIMKLNQVKVLQAEDDQNNSMLSIGNPNYYPWQFGYSYGNNQRNYCQSTSVTLSWPRKSSKLVKNLRGVIPITLLAEQKPTVVTDDLANAKGKKFQVEEGAINVESVTKTSGGKQVEIKLGFTMEGGENPWDYGRIQGIQQRFELHDARGNKLQAYVRMFSFSGPGSATMTLSTQPGQNSKLGPPAKLVFIKWVQLNHEVAFQFRDLPLP